MSSDDVLTQRLIQGGCPRSPRFEVASIRDITLVSEGDEHNPRLEARSLDPPITGVGG
jgi:hypothetical protein